MKEFSETVGGMLRVLLKRLTEVKEQHVDQTLDDKTIVDLFEKVRNDLPLSSSILIASTLFQGGGGIFDFFHQMFGLCHLFSQETFF